MKNKKAFLLISFSLPLFRPTDETGPACYLLPPSSLLRQQAQPAAHRPPPLSSLPFPALGPMVAAAARPTPVFLCPSPPSWAQLGLASARGGSLPSGLRSWPARHSLLFPSLLSLRHGARTSAGHLLLPRRAGGPAPAFTTTITPPSDKGHQGGHQATPSRPALMPCLNRRALPPPLPL